MVATRLNPQQCTTTRILESLTTCILTVHLVAIIAILAWCRAQERVVRLVKVGEVLVGCWMGWVDGMLIESTKAHTVNIGIDHLVSSSSSTERQQKSMLSAGNAA